MPTKYLKDFYWRDYVTMTLGLALYAIGLIGFIKPGGIVTGGLTGIALLVEYSTKGVIQLQNVFFVVNCVLLLLAFKVLGFKFIVKTLYSVVVLTLFLTIARHIITEPLIEEEPLLSGVIGGMMCGAGIGLVFSVNGSTGGTDIIVAIINKYKSLTFGRGMMLCDLTIICSSYFVSQDYNKIVAGLIVMAVMTYVIDMVINGFRQSVQFLIFSEKYEIIADAINKELKRGCTVLDGTGWYTKKSTKVIILLAKRSESVDIFRMIRSIDEKAFISQTNTRGVYGEGFDQMK
ncbi:YitT family protein [Dysgonomonas sp. 520]|uniref:YitT family protein n=1 Tax=Dysgonomonas sp. 520 TaxID=2302931 RepID=UPI0013D1E6E8|nr:YitT family protein [Dysgonomonas sp. 520]NDW08601.1 YitT family protein [Dysgonomonas sp. 520]